LKVQSDCTVCPAGSYCTQGRIQGKCKGGWFCKGGQDSPMPVAPLTESLKNEVKVLLIYLETLPGGPCPPGRYCPEGTSTPIECPMRNGTSTVRSDPYGAVPSDCTACAAGMVSGRQLSDVVLSY
jgi:hypothetical protein